MDITESKLYSIGNCNIYGYTCEDGCTTNGDCNILKENQEVKMPGFKNCFTIYNCTYKPKAEHNSKPARICFYADHKVYSCKEFEVNADSERDALIIAALRCKIKYDSIKDIKSTATLIEVIEPHLVSHLVDSLIAEKQIEEGADNYYLNKFSGTLFVYFNN